MKKRRVLALLLALSLTFGTNGMTVLATEADVPGASVTLDEGVADAVESENSDDDRQTDDSIEDSESEGQDQGEVSGEEDNIDNPDGDNGSQNQNDVDNVENADAGDYVLNGEDHVSDSEEDITSEGAEAPGEIEGESDEEMPGDADTVSEVRMMTFTDDTGMKITYDANAAQQYIYTVEDGVLTKVERSTGGDGEKEDVIFTGNVELTQPDEGEKYTSIAASIFAGNTKITYVKLPSEITKITEGLFKGCTALKGVYLPSTVTIIEESAFETCTAMTQIAVPKTVESIGNSAFKGDARLYMVYMKDVDYSVLTSIGDHAFGGCSVLSVFCSDTEFQLPTSVTEIGAYAFNDCKSIAKVDLDTAELTSMGEYAFAGCTGLTDAVIGMSKKETVSTISQHAFDGCTALASLTFSSKVGQWVKIDEYAFYGCYGLKQLVLPGTISEVANFAFAGCTNLNRIEVKNDNLIIGETKAFPVGETKNILLFVGSNPSKIYSYFRALASDKVDFKETNAKEYYKYTVEDINGIECLEGKIPGGQIWIGKPDSPNYDNNINTLNGGKGVQNDNAVRYCIYVKANAGYKLVSGSVRANGLIVQPEKGSYYVTMPLGGIVISAEFSQDTAEKVVGLQNNITVEFSNGEIIKSGDEAIGVEIKVGQTTRMFLIDGSGAPVSSSKIKTISSAKTSVAKVSNSGVITAVGKGTTTITVTLIGGDGNPIVIPRNIRVVEADVDTIKLKATDYDDLINISGDPDGIQTAAINKNVVRNEGLSITLKANAYTSDREGIAKELTWKTSDAKIAKVMSASTTSADAVNVVEIQAGCEGEATITVTAKNSSGADKQTVTQKFVISVQNITAKLAYASIKVNPNLEEGGTLEVIPSYGATIKPEQTKLYKQDKNSQGKTFYIQTLDFSLEYKAAESDKSYCYSVIPTEDLKEDTYKTFVCFNNDTPETGTALPLTITVKKAAPAPTVKFNTKKTKFNLFYKNGGTDKDGNPITVTTEVTKLGTVKIKKFELDALSASDDDRMFLDNFEIVNNPEELAKGIVTIKRKDGNLKYTRGKKAAVTGNLVIYYEGYRDEVAKKVKVTMPTVTTAPSYVLDRTSVTYRDTSPRQEETLSLLDKKTKQRFVLDQSKTQVTVDTHMSAVSNNDCIIDANGDIAFGVAYPESGKVKFILQNTDWDTDKDGKDRTLTYTFTVKTANNEPTIKTDPKTVTVNSNYKENKASFGLVSNQGDTKLQSRQIFDYNHGAKNAAEYEKLAVDYSNGVGTVEITDASIKTGTYTWTCEHPVEQDDNELSKKVTLTVKVVNTPPTVKLGNGSLSLNLAAGTRGEQGTTYSEMSEIPLKITGQPEGYILDTNVNTGGPCTTIVCTTANESGKEKVFDWFLEDIKKTEDGKLEDGKLGVSLKNGVAAKTYSFKMTLRYINQKDGTPVLAKPITIKVKVYSNSNISLTLSAKGKLNLVDREGEYTTKNSIIYTPTLKNIKGTITDAKIYDADTDKESRYFDIYLSQKDGKLYVTPKKTSDLESGYQYADVENNKSYGVKIWVNVSGYSGRDDRGGIWSKIINIKTAQILPKVTTDKSTLNVYLSKKDYDATFVVTPQSGSAGIIESIQFGEKDEVSQDAFQIMYEKQDNGSLKVTVHLKEAVAFACDSTNNVKMYVKYKGQGTNTAGTVINMNVKINK